MTIDLRQFHQVFFEETTEHLETMECVLLEISPDTPAPASIDALFRAAHSIKGGAGTFGFPDLAEVAHALEASLDRARRGSTRLSTGMVDALLRAVDVLRRQLDAHRGRGPADPAEAAALPTLLRQAEADTLQLPAPPPPTTAAALLGRSSIDLHFDAKAAATPEALDRLLNALLDLGEMDVLQSGDAANAEQWRFRLRTDLALPALRDHLSFLVPPASLRLIAEDQRDAGTVPPGEADYGFFPDAPGAPEPAKAAQAPTPNPATPPASATVLPLASAAKEAAEPAPLALEQGSIRVSVHKVDQLLNLMSELVINQAMVAQAATKLDPLLHERLCLGIEQFERHTRALQEAVMSLRLLPIGSVFSRFPRVVHDLARQLNKQVRLVIVGEATELDRGLIEKITDPLTHLLRNSLDHGIEAPATRRAAGKDETGTITLEAYHQGGSMVIEVGDDGAGLDRERILAKAREQGFAVGNALTDEEVWRLILSPGFSTATTVTAVSGRGVGMDVVLRNVQALGGRLELESRPGQGTTVRLRLPLTLAILDGMAVAVGSELYVIPLGMVVESLQPAPGQLKTVAGRGRLVQVREQYLPLLPLHELFSIAPLHPNPAQGIVVVIDCDGRQLALQVDDLVLQQQFVIKNLERNYRRVPGIAGATILGDGRVALILDPAGLARMSARTTARAA
ncbi:MAG: chemotaxis protein CheA [Betaproteobacteria bacterium]|nr:chemotaxis protein CheA [Betaproteobacteria bacterium]